MIAGLFWYESRGGGHGHSVSDERQCPLKIYRRHGARNWKAIKVKSTDPRWMTDLIIIFTVLPHTGTQWRCGEKRGFPRRKLRSYGWVLALFKEILDRRPVNNRHSESESEHASEAGPRAARGSQIAIARRASSHASHEPSWQPVVLYLYY